MEEKHVVLINRWLNTEFERIGESYQGFQEDVPVGVGTGRVIVGW